MTLSRQFVKAEIKAHDGIFQASITYSYYGLYQFVEHQVCGSLDAAKMWVIEKRCTLPGGVIAYSET